ncbi:MAG: hypothetical protein RL346_303 [Verrucomicrobiota bacterium]
MIVSLAGAKGLYHVPNENEEASPIKWSVGMAMVWDDNTTPTAPGSKDQTVSLNTYLGVEFASKTPQTTWDVYARLGMLYYLDQPTAAGSDDMYGQARVGANLTHRFDPRLVYTTRNFVSYELEPDYSYGFATNRQSSEYLYLDTDHSIGYRWSTRFATYTGLKLTLLDYDSVENSDRFTWMAYHQFRYSLTQQTTATASIRYAQTTAADAATDSTDQYLLGGIEHRLSPTTILVTSAGLQFRSVDAAGGSDSTNPYIEATLRSQLNRQFTISAFTRYGAEPYDTVQGANEYDSRMTLRVGVKGDYQLSEKLKIFSGIDMIRSSFEEGRVIATSAPVADQGETLYNMYVGTSLQLAENLFGTITYNFTDTNSDFAGRSYDRNRISVGLMAEF